jgi:hypothetical protein
MSLKKQLSPCYNKGDFLKSLFYLLSPKQCSFSYGPFHCITILGGAYLKCNFLNLIPDLVELCWLEICILNKALKQILLRTIGLIIDFEKALTEVELRRFVQ